MRQLIFCIILLLSCRALADSPLPSRPASLFAPPSAAPSNTSGFISGTCGTVGGVGFFTAAQTESCSSNFVFDSVNNRVGIGTATPQRDLDVTLAQNAATTILVLNATNNTAASAEIRLAGTTSTAADYLVIGYGAVLNSAPEFANRGYLTAGTSASGLTENVGTGDFRWTTGSPPASTERMRLTTTGLGIGTAQGPSANPTEKLDLFGTGVVRILARSDVDAQTQLESGGGAASFPAVVQYGHRGTIAAPTATQSGDVLGSIFFGGYNSSVNTSRSFIKAFATENWTTSAEGNDIEFFTATNGSTTATNVLTINTTQATGRNGTANAPGWSFIGDPDTGMFSKSANVIGWSVGTVETMSLASGALTVVGTIGFAGGTTTGTITFSGSDPDIVTASGENLTIRPAGAGTIRLEPSSSAAGRGAEFTASSTGFMMANEQGGSKGAFTSTSGNVTYVGSQGNQTIGQKTACFGDGLGANAGTDLFCVDGVGILTMQIGVTANNNLSGTSACAASGDVGKIVLYSDTGSSKISQCVCTQTGAGTFAWGATTTTGDCT